MAPRKESDRPGEPWTKPGTELPEKRPGPFAQDPARTPPTKGRRERDQDEDEDDKMDAVIRDTPL